VSKLNMMKMPRRTGAKSGDVWSSGIGCGQARRCKSVFVSFNASFDGSFVKLVFHKYLRETRLAWSARHHSLLHGILGLRLGARHFSQLPQDSSPTPTDSQALDDARAQGRSLKVIKAKTKGPSEDFRDPRFGQRMCHS